MPHATGIGRSMTEMEAMFRERADLTPTVARCSFCPGLEWEGQAREVREAARQHRLDVHPEVARKRRRRGPPNPATFVQSRMTVEEEAEVEVERRRRLRLHGIELAEPAEI